MGESDQLDTSRTAIKTYIPAYQKDIWTEHADQLDMNLSEFVRTMVQAGRRDFDLDTDADQVDSLENGTSDGNGVELADQVTAILERDGPTGWDDLVEQLTEDVEDRLEDAIETLQDENRVRYNGRERGYTIVEES